MIPTSASQNGGATWWSSGAGSAVRVAGKAAGWLSPYRPAGYRPSARVWMTSSRRNVSHLYADPDGTLGVANDTLTGATFVDLLIHAAWLI